MTYQGPERRNGVTDMRVLEERINNYMDESNDDRRRLWQEHNSLREQTQTELKAMREQTHEWMQAMLQRLPPWAVAVGSIMTTALGGMAMWIMTHK